MAISRSQIPKSVKNPALYKKAKAKAKAKFDVYPSAYANAYMVKEYKKMGGTYKAKGGAIKKRTPKEITKIVRSAAKESNRTRAFEKMGLDPSFEYAIDKTKSGPSRLVPVGKRKIVNKNSGGEIKKLKPIPADNKGLKKLPTKVRNNMGFMKNGGSVMVQGRGCGAMMQSKRKKTRVPRG